VKASFKDIIKRAGKPKWYDENGTPRYGKFHPDMSPNIYAEQVLLIQIGCQSCPKKFLVEMNYCKFHQVHYRCPRGPFKIEGRIPHYGDPPIHGCVGDTENCEDIKIVEFWNRNNCAHEWELLKQKGRKYGKRK
jgi:hypothetical protein